MASEVEEIRGKETGKQQRWERKKRKGNNYLGRVLLELEIRVNSEK